MHLKHQFVCWTPFFTTKLTEQADSSDLKPMWPQPQQHTHQIWVPNAGAGQQVELLLLQMQPRYVMQVVGFARLPMAAMCPMMQLGGCCR